MREQRYELPRIELQRTCWMCGHVFVEDDQLLCDGCAIVRRHEQRIENMIAEREAGRAKRCAA